MIERFSTVTGGVAAPTALSVLADSGQDCRKEVIKRVITAADVVEIQKDTGAYIVSFKGVKIKHAVLLSAQDSTGKLLTGAYTVTLKNDAATAGVNSIVIIDATTKNIPANGLLTLEVFLGN